MRPGGAASLAWRMIKGQAPRAWLFVFCIALGVAARTGVGSFLGSLDQALARDSRSLLGADLELSGGSPLDPAKAQDLAAFLPAGSRLSARVSLLSMASAGPVGARQSRLVQLAAVDGAYPLAGALKVSGAAGALTAAQLQGRPWAYAQPELLAPLGLTLGARLRLGTRDFVLAGLLHDEPGLGAGAFSLGPRVLIGADQAATAGLTGFGSRVTYETLIGLPDPAQGEAVAAALRQRWDLQPSHTWRGQAPSAGTIRLRSVRDAQEQVRGFFDRLADYLSLVSLMALLLGGVGVAGVTRGFVREAAVSRGVLASVGAAPATVAGLFAWQCLGLGLAGGLLGALGGALAQGLLGRALAGLLPVALGASWQWRPLAWGLALGLLTALAFGLEPVLEAAAQSPASLLRDEEPTAPRWRRWRGLPLPSAVAWWRLGAALLFAGVAALEARSWVRGPGAFAALLLAAALLQALAGALLPWLARARAWPLPFSLRQALANLGRPGLRAGAGLVALGSAALLLGVLAVYQHSLLTELAPARERGRLPDLFFIDAQPGQLDGLRALVAARCPGATLRLSPMVRGRYRGILGQPEPVSAPARTREQEEAQALRSREQNLSWRDALGPGETLSAGKWMDPAGDEVECSLEDYFAQRLGAKLGDVLRFDVQGVEVQARVSSLRKVDWASFQPNFFVLLSPWALKDAPQTWIGSVANSGGPGPRAALQAAVVARYPNVTIFEVAEATAKILAILDKIAAAIQLVALACLATGLVVLAGLGLASARSRRGEAALLKVLGASRRQLLSSAAAEFGLLAGLAAVLGLALSLALGWVLLVKVLELEDHAPWLLLLQLTLLFSATGAAVGVASTWTVYQAPPAEVLRQD